MNSVENPDPAAALPTAIDAVLSAPELVRIWPDLPPRARKLFVVAAARQFHELWRSGVELDAFPAAVWGWRVADLSRPLALPVELSASVQKPISRGRLVRAMSDWLCAPAMPFAEGDRLRALISFARSAAWDRMTRRALALNIARSARKNARTNARETYLDVLGETNHLCRQAVGCRGVWLPDTRRSADEFRRDVEAAIRAVDAIHLKQSDVAQVTRTWLQGEEVVIKRHRFAKAGKRLKYLWRMSRARRAWATALSLQRLGMPVAEPLGFLEIMRKGRVTDSYIINRWLPGCRTARETVEQELVGSPRAELRRSIAIWRTAWLTLLSRGIYHADTKLSNALVRMNGAEPIIYWIDLECVQVGATFTPYRLLRNIVQMNGSLARNFPLRDRLWFLKKLPAHLRWLRSRRCNRIIAWWTARRLGDEKRGVAGP